MHTTETLKLYPSRAKYTQTHQPSTMANEHVRSHSQSNPGNRHKRATLNIFGQIESIFLFQLCTVVRDAQENRLLIHTSRCYFVYYTFQQHVFAFWNCTASSQQQHGRMGGQPNQHTSIGSVWVLYCIIIIIILTRPTCGKSQHVGTALLCEMHARIRLQNRNTAGENENQMTDTKPPAVVKVTPFYTFPDSLG